VNPFAIVGAVVAAAVVLSVYYAPPVLGTRWAGVVTTWTGQSRDDLADRVLARMGMWVISAAINVTVLAYLFDRVSVTGLGESIVLAVVLWLGFGATFSAWPVFFANQPWSLWLINNGAFLATQVVAAAVLALAS
jgi:hypothetical protein